MFAWLYFSMHLFFYAMWIVCHGITKRMFIKMSYTSRLTNPAVNLLLQSEWIVYEK